MGPVRMGQATGVEPRGGVLGGGRRQQAYWGPCIRGEDPALPKSWGLLYREGTTWRPVELLKDDAYTLRLDRPYEVRFKPVATRAIRLEAEFSGAPCAIPEWRSD